MDKRTSTPAAPGGKALPLLHCVITVALMILVGLIPPIAPITPYGMKIIGILVGIVYGMSTVDVLWTAICAILGMGLAAGNVVSVVSAALGSTLVWGIIMVLIILYAMQTEHVTDFFANWIISRKVLQGRPWLFSFAILVGISILAMVSPIATMLLFWDIIYAACDQVGIERNSPWGQCMIFGSCFAAGSGILYLPVIANGMVVNNMYLGMMGEPINAMKYVAAMIPLVLLGIVIYVLLCKFVLRIDVSALKNLDGSIVNKDALKVNSRQLMVMISVVALVVILLAGSVLPSSWAVTGFIKNMDLFGLGAIVVLLFAVVKIDGRPIITIQEAASKGIIWSMVVMTALIAPLGSALTSPDAGITELISSFLAPVLEGKPAWILVAVVCVVGVLLTNLAQNLVIMSVILPIVIAMSATMNINITAVAILLAISTHYAFVLPSACPAAGMMFSNPYLKPTFAYKTGLLCMVVCTIFVLTLGYFWVNLIF
ncbi:MAG: SLC13 family permease [Oscillospiraceae bacterium]|nr:SLC13 family permease [Oscillospiraceae bacterium]